MSDKKLLCEDFKKMKKNSEKIVMVTSYSYPQASAAIEAGVDCILIGDSLGMVELGYSGTVPVTMDDMLLHAKSVRRAGDNVHVICDMPFMSYNISVEQAIENAGILYQKGGADSVKLEGGTDYANVIAGIRRAGIPVCAHIGLTPQTAALLGGFKTQGRTAEAAKKLIDDAYAVQDAGAFMIVLECIPYELAQIITEKLTIPTIGIGSGAACDGQVLVYHDLLGMFKRFTPSFVKVYKNLYQEMEEGLAAYTQEVKASAFPTDAHAKRLKPEVYQQIIKDLNL
ncbi:MAG: 3-methyl-2-oxobutanoate hydroxymethyltransferase [Spirochaetia bacterium]|nr:3-methyl-2-oxobutanoate hydroxymethyltransferase [Spirochaetia bacterium]